MAKYTLSINGENLSKIVKKQKDGLPKLIEEFMLKHYKTKLDKMGNVLDDNNQFLISKFFFKSINPMPNVEPIYNSEQLSMVWDLYMYIIEEVNTQVTMLPPTLTHFAKFAGISLDTLKSFKYDLDENMRILFKKIDDEVRDANLLLAQNKKIVAKTTEFRLKVENETIEKKTPNVNISLNAKTLDLDKINERLVEINTITRKQVKYEGK